MPEYDIHTDRISLRKYIYLILNDVLKSNWVKLMRENHETFYTVLSILYLDFSYVKTLFRKLQIFKIQFNWINIRPLLKLIIMYTCKNKQSCFILLQN